VRSVHAWNALAVAAALATALCGAALAVPPAPAARPLAASDAPVVTATDASGTALPVRDYQRIASAGLAADGLLAALVEPGRIVAYSSFSIGAESWRYAGYPRLTGLQDLEAIVALHPDLVLCCPYGNEHDRLARLRAAGLTVCDFGEQGGVDDLLRQARLLGALLGCPARAERFCTDFARRLRAVAADLPPQRPRRRALLLDVVGDYLYGGTVGTSYHDVLLAAGLADAAAARYRKWPQYAVEEIIALDPDLFVTATGNAARLRRLPALAGLRAVRDPAGIIEVPAEVLGDPGPAMLTAAEALHAALVASGQ
jgi:iron complex transport system substrate-binding protein